MPIVKQYAHRIKINTKAYLQISAWVINAKHFIGIIANTCFLPEWLLWKRSILPGPVFIRLNSTSTVLPDEHPSQLHFIQVRSLSLHGWGIWWSVTSTWGKSLSQPMDNTSDRIKFKCYRRLVYATDFSWIKWKELKPCHQFDNKGSTKRGLPGSCLPPLCCR